MKGKCPCFFSYKMISIPDQSGFSGCDKNTWQQNVWFCLKMFGQNLYRNDCTGIKRFTTEINLTSIYYLVKEKWFYCSVIFYF